MTKFEVTSLGHIETPFKQKLGIPRQPGLAPSAEGIIHLNKEYAREDTLRGLESFDYLWIFFWCHESHSWRETVKPPRLGGKEKVGVFATRSPHRPNPIAISAVKLEKITDDYKIIVSGVDLLDQTPILDIKPYIHMWDSHPNASLGWINNQPELPAYPVVYKSEEFKKLLDAKLELLLFETLRWNPRPSYQKNLEQTFTHTVGHVDVTWRFDGEQIIIENISQ